MRELGERGPRAPVKKSVALRQQAAQRGLEWLEEHVGRRRGWLVERGCVGPATIPEWEGDGQWLPWGYGVMRRRLEGFAERWEGCELVVEFDEEHDLVLRLYNNMRQLDEIKLRKVEDGGEIWRRMGKLRDAQAAFAADDAAARPRDAEEVASHADSLAE